MLLGVHKRDDYCSPVMSSDVWKINYLRKAKVLMDDWKKAKKLSLSGETFSAWTQTLSASADLSQYLVEKHHFKYVLLGKFQSDPLEGHFGMYQQLNGASYFMSVRQVMLAEKKIRILNQMQLAKCHQAQLDIQRDCDVSSSLLSNDIEWLASQLSIPEECDLTGINSDLVYYVAGSIGRSVGWVKKCTDCNTLLVDRHIDTIVELMCDEECAATRHYLHTVEEKDDLLDLVNRIGLAHPTDYCYAVCKTIFLFLH